MTRTRFPLIATLTALLASLRSPKIRALTAQTSAQTGSKPRVRRW